MKRCPQCRKDYLDDSLLYCLDDGSVLVQGVVGDMQTAIFPSGITSDPATRPQVFDTGKTEVLTSREELNLPKSGSFDKRLLLAPIVLAAIVVAGVFGYRYLKPAGDGSINSIAVLPFQNRSGDPNAEYLSDGLAESLIYRLSQIASIKVSPTSSVIQYKGKETKVADIANELGVDAVMTGRLSQIGDNLTISVELVDVRNNKLLWGEQYERKMSELLATQREIATTITQKLQLKLSGEESKGVTKKYTDNNEAYQAYLKGRYHWNRRTAENLKKAIEQFKSATDRDPNFALAFTGLADCYAILPEYAGIPLSETLPQAKTYAERALAIDDQLAEAHASMGQVYKMSWNWAESEREYKRAIELNPNYATAYHWYSHVLRSLGRYDEALEIIKRGHEFDPLSSVVSVNLSEVYELKNDYQASIENAQKIIEIDPNFAYAYVRLGTCYLKQGRNEEAIANLEKGVEVSNRASYALMNLGYGYAFVGKRPEAMAIAKELEERYARKQSPGVFIAAVYSGLGEKDKAFAWMEKDYQEKGDLGFIRWRVPFEPLRDDPRFKDLMRRLNLPE